MKELDLREFSNLLRNGFKGYALFSGKVTIQDPSSIFFRARGAFRLEFDSGDRYHSLGLLGREDESRMCRDSPLVEIDFVIAKPKKFQYLSEVVSTAVSTPIFLGRQPSHRGPDYSLRIEPTDILY